MFKKTDKHEKPAAPKKEKEVAVEVDVTKCDCGKDVHPGSHQCWACAHRA